MTFQEMHIAYSRPKKICGIYKITNIYTKESYIGKSNDIQRRWNEHRSPNEWKRNPNQRLYQDMKELGSDAFSFEILEECSRKELNKKEKEWVDFYDTFVHGYNNTRGGDGHSPDDAHPNHKLSMQDIIDIRTSYANHERKCFVEERYKDKIGPSGFAKVWNGFTWSDVMPEVFTEENRAFHRNNTGCKGSMNGRALVTEEDVIAIRKRRNAGEDSKEVYKDYKYTGIKREAFMEIWRDKKWKHVLVS